MMVDKIPAALLCCRSVESLKM